VTSREPLGSMESGCTGCGAVNAPPMTWRRAEDLEGSDRGGVVSSARARAKEFRPSSSTTRWRHSWLGVPAPRGIPLAIELAASRLSSMSLDDLHGRLDQRFRLLTGWQPQRPAAPSRPWEPRAWSFDLLTEPEARPAATPFGLIDGSGFDLAGRRAVCAESGFESFDVADLLSSLVNKSLVTRRAHLRTFTALSITRNDSPVTSADQLVQIDGDAETARTRQLHAEHYLKFCLEIAPELEGPKQGTMV